MTRDSGWVTGAIVMQFLWASALLVLPAYLLLLARSSAILSEQDAAEAISGLRIAAAILILPAIVAAVAWFGLWKRKLWGSWSGLAGDLGIVAMLVYSVLDDGLHNPDWMIGLTITAVVPVAFLLLPPVRRSYWRVGPLEGVPAA
jgi:uncharacterized membrane protein (DUF2068 family)